MTKKLQHIFALSEKGARDLVKAVIWCFVCNLALMFPVGAVLFTVQHLLGCLESSGSPMDGFWLYVGFALAVLLLLFVLHWFQYASLYIATYQESANRRVSLAETLRRIAPYCEILTDTVRVTEENLPALLEKDGIVCEAFDRPEAKAMLVSGVLEHFPDKPLVAASGMAGLGSANTIRTRRAFGRLYLCGDGTSDVSGVLGLVSARVAVCAAHQAHTVLRILAGEPDI